jgi:hypothetical protein
VLVAGWVDSASRWRVGEGSGEFGEEIEVLVGEVLIGIGEGLAQEVNRSRNMGSSQRVMAGDYIIGLG